MAQYVDNKKLYEAYVTWYKDIEKAKEDGKAEPQPPRIIQQAIIDIPTHLASRFNFNGYTFKEEMIGDAIENLVNVIKNFDVSKYKNPYGYFTQISYFAFIRRILRERKQSYVKHCLIQNSGILDQLNQQEHDDQEYSLSFMQTLQANLNPALEEYYNGKKAEPTGPVKKKGRPRRPTVDLEELTNEEAEVLEGVASLVEILAEEDDQV